MVIPNSLVYRVSIRCLCLLVLAGGVNIVFAQPRLFKAADLTDFPRGNVQGIVQDKFGFLWVATTDGLAKYDGHQLLEYRYTPYDTNTLSSNYITDLSLDQAGNVLAATRNGLSIYLQAEDRFIRLAGNGDKLPDGTSDIVHHVVQDQRGFYWHGTYQGLFRRKHLRAEAEQILPNEQLAKEIPYETVWKIQTARDGRLWIGSGTGLILSDTSGTQFQVFSREGTAQHGLTAQQTWAFAELADGTMYIGSESGVYRAEQGEEGWYFHHEFGDNLSDPFVNWLFNEGDSILWVGTHRGGLNEVDLRTKTVVAHRHDSQQANTLGVDQIEAIYRDRSNMLWVGAGGFLQYTTPQLDNFKTVAVVPHSPASLSNNIIKSVLFDHEHNLWVGTYDGLNRLDSAQWMNKAFAFESFQTNNSASRRISHNNIFGLFEDSRQMLWAATFNGLNYLDLNAPPEQQKFTALTFKDGLPHDIIYEVKEIQTGQYWVATYGKLARMYFDPSLPREVKFDWFTHGSPGEGNIVNATVYTMAQDRFGRWWFATYDGLSQHRFRDGEDFFDNYQHLPGDSTSLSDNSIRCLFLDSKDRFWIGTRTGLNLAQQEEATDRASFRSFGMREGFPNDVIHFIEEDQTGLFWIGTNAGLVVFNPDKAIAGQPPIEKVYTSSDGLAASTFVFRSSHQDEDGQLFIGSPSGLNYFHPQQLAINGYTPPVTLTALRINNEIIRPDETDQTVLSAPIQQTQAMVLTHRQNQIEITFSTMDFRTPTENTYAYRLLGWHDNWLGAKGQYRAQYNQLPPGQYTFQVKAANSDGQWSSNLRELVITIRPPIWRTGLAYFIYALLFGFLIWQLIRQRVKQRTRTLAQQYAIDKARQEERVQLRQKNAADFHDELGHRLTKISLFLELAKRNIRQPQELFTHFQKIKQHVDGLSSGMRDLIWALDPQKDNLLQTSMRLRDFGDQLFDYSPTRFQGLGIGPELETIQLQPDVRQQLLLLFKEAMHNCLKYAQASEARLEITVVDANINILFQDNGRGFIEEQSTSSGYGLKNMRKRAEKIGATLIIESSRTNGTTIHLRKIPRLG